MLPISHMKKGFVPIGALNMFTDEASTSSWDKLFQWLTTYCD